MNSDSPMRPKSKTCTMLGWRSFAACSASQPVAAPVEDALFRASVNASLVVIGEPQNGRRRELAARLSERCACPVVTVGVGRTPALAG